MINLTNMANHNKFGSIKHFQKKRFRSKFIWFETQMNLLSQGKHALSNAH